MFRPRHIRKVKGALESLKDELDSIEYIEEKDRLDQMRLELRMIIRRIYPDSQTVEKSLLSSHVNMELINPHKAYEDMIKETRTAIHIILQEERLFGLKNFTPVISRWGIKIKGIFYEREKSEK